MIQIATNTVYKRNCIWTVWGHSHL